MAGLFFNTWHLQHPLDKNLENVLLKHYGIDSADKQSFFFDDHLLFHAQNLLKDYQKAIDRILQAIKDQERIIIFGDYDVDGVMGVVILFQILLKAGAKVSYRIPNRQKDGYGLKKYFIDELHAKNVTLIITVDNGIAAINEVKHAKELGIDVIITDHHQVQDEIPPALAIINHQQSQCNYPFTDLCGAALAYKLALGLAEHFLSPDDYQNYHTTALELVTLATIADLVPLVDENRLIVKKGLKYLRQTSNVGLQELAKQANIDLLTCDTDTIAFQIAPRINAAGRIDEANLAVQLLLGKTENAEKLEMLNNQRKALVEKALAEAEALINPEGLLIATSLDWHTGIIGLIAGKLTEKYGFPSIILEEQANRFVASCRSPKGFDIYKLLKPLSDYFIHFGGHAQAAGFAISKEKYPQFKIIVEQQAKQLLLEKPLTKMLNITVEIDLADINFTTLNLVEKFAPFGCGNERPSFLIKQVKNIEWKAIGQNNDHLIGLIPIGKNQNIKIIKFGAASIINQLKKAQNYDIVFNLSKNYWQNQARLQLELIDIKLYFNS